MSEIVKTKSKFKFKHDWWGYVFISPFFIIFAIFQLYPMVMSFVYAFTDFGSMSFNHLLGTKSYNFVGFDKFGQLFADKRFWRSLMTTGFIWGVNFAPQLILALLFGAMFTSARFRLHGRGAFKVIYFLPNILTATSIALLFNLLFDTNAGPITKLFRDWGIFRTDPNYVLLTDYVGTSLLISFIQFWRYFGQSMIILAAGMLGVNPSLYEAAEVDGASKVRQFFSITLPSLKPIMLYSLVTSLVGGLQMFDIPYLMSGAISAHGLETIAAYIYKISFSETVILAETEDFALSSAASVILFFISVFLSFMLFLAMKERQVKEIKVKGVKKQHGTAN